MLKIGDFSKLSRISIRSLRHYDELGILIPETVDSFTGYRYYKESQLENAGRINSLKAMGLSLLTISEILKNYSDKNELEKFLKTKKSELLSSKIDLEEKLILIETAISRLKEEDNYMDYNVVLKDMPEKYVASVRDVIPAYNNEGMLWERMYKEVDFSKVKYDTPCLATAIFYDEGYKETDVDVEIQVSVLGEYENTENVTFKKVSAIKNVATITYKGSYNQITDVFGAIANWINDNGYEINGSMFSIYHVSPAMEQNPENYVTEVCFPVRKK